MASQFIAEFRRNSLNDRRDIIVCELWCLVIKKLYIGYADLIQVQVFF